VLSNLVANAVKFTRQGGVHIHVGFDAADPKRAPGAATPRLVRIEVADSGIGIDAARLETLFKPFHQADETVTRRYGGTGLGLSISRSLAHLMGGRIEVTSRAGAGSVFALVMPLLFPDESMPPAGRPERRGRALLATATKGLSRHVAGQLDELGIDAVAVDGVPDLIALRQSRAEIVFVDSTLLRGNAGEATRRLDELTRLGVKVVVVLPLGGEATRDAAIGTLLVYKPVRRSSLRALLDGDAQDAAPAAAPEAGAPPVAAGTTTTRIPVILVVDDDETNRIVVHSMLAGRGATVLIASDGQDALDVLRREPVEVVLMDVQMPRLDGLAATRALRQREQSAGARRTPVVAMTGSGEADERSACLEAGMDAFLIKPFRLEELRRTVEAFLLSRKIEA
jgi:two-component system, NarL family, sensor histidine kinase BarA